MRRRLIIIVVIAIAAVAVTAVYAGWFNRDASLQGSGTVEARNIRVGSKVGGRILQVLVREGDRVQPGQTLITFDDKELQASLEQARANAQKAQRGFRKEEIQEAQAAATQAKADFEMHLKGYRKEDIDAAQADVDRAIADETRARLDFRLRLQSAGHSGLGRAGRSRAGTPLLVPVLFSYRARPCRARFQSPRVMPAALAPVVAELALRRRHVRAQRGLLR